MKRDSLITAVLAVLFILQSNTAGHTELGDSITLSVRNPGTITLTNDQVPQILQKADFEGHGFQKEESRTLLSAGKFPANSSAYMTNIFYYKEVACSQAKQVLMEVGKILPGAMKPSGSCQVKVAREMRVISGGDPTARCKAGVEIHFKPKPRQTSTTVPALRRFKRDISASICCIICIFCK
ncbi:unnamed protein product [Pocillopora meandrina]|uniref:Uncharacterized protein n=1 Tax=Pocillopora meandrina TaxID=46732 RepID=A0AAU9VX58_9CNID|nr:unnamed protein product [Pocillopora meandrina]